MLLVDEQKLSEFETDYPGIGGTIRYYENLTLPYCSACGSCNTAKVSVGFVWRSFKVSSATTKFKLLANPSRSEPYFCNACSRFFS